MSLLVNRAFHDACPKPAPNKACPKPVSYSLPPGRSIELCRMPHVRARPDKACLSPLSFVLCRALFAEVGFKPRSTSPQTSLQRAHEVGDERHKMISSNSREENFTSKEESKTVGGKKSKGTASSTSSITPWSRLRDPRIVRVSRASGGKDRHSKVCTVKGLRDRRVRLSAPTAIQLYDLQDRLGLNQPSKVVDWLLNASKQDIDELPPLQIPQENFGENYGNSVSRSDKELGFQSNHRIDWDDSLGLSRSNFWNPDATLRDKVKGISTEMDDRKESWNQTSNEEEKQGQSIRPLSSQDNVGSQSNTLVEFPPK
ncbi:hypothetical protein Vadar_032957 [Vaccinium darrowii]|uniref:Uncharacterized protein n=1 Tax=Vaccinium darrowii TaxID=229202 RepID=A0ACB7Y4A8_9ERIC|nr:hypothetical protein Vadar_032957 [Vaccinium darrowii]